MSGTVKKGGGASVSAVTTIDFGDLARRLLDDERNVLREYGNLIMRVEIKDRWKGWDYKDRPDSAPINVSLKAWKQRIETTEGKAVLFITNDAKDWRTKSRSYAAYVHRSGDKTTEIEYITRDIQSAILPDMVRDLTDAVVRNLTAPKRRRKLRMRGGGVTRKLALEG